MARAKVILVIQIDAVSDSIEATLRAKLFHQGEEFVFAEEAALCVVAYILWAIEFRGRNHLKWNRLLQGKCNRVGELSSRQARGVSDDRQHLISQRLMGGPGQVGGIDTAGIGDEKTTQRAQAGLQRYAFCADVHSCG